MSFLINVMALSDKQINGSKFLHFLVGCTKYSWLITLPGDYVQNPQTASTFVRQNRYKLLLIRYQHCLVAAYTISQFTNNMIQLN